MAETYISQAPSSLAQLWGRMRHPINTAKIYMGNKLDQWEAAKNFRNDPGPAIRRAFAPNAYAADYGNFDNTPFVNDNSQVNTPNIDTRDSSGGGNSYNDAEQEAKDKFKKQAGKAYGSLRDTLGELSGFTSKDEEKMYKNIRGMGSQLRSGLETNYAGQKGVLNKEYGNVQSDQRNSLGQLYNSVQSQMKAGNDYLGTRGAGDSSASQMYARGLMGEASGNRRNILGQAREQYAEIETKRKQADLFYEQQTSNIDRDTERKIEAVKNSFKEQRNKLAKLASNADDYERADIENLDTKNLEKAYGAIEKIDNARQQWLGQLEGWKTDVYDRMDALKSELINMTQFTAEEIAMPELNADMQDMPTNEDEAGQAIAKKRTSLRDFLDNPLGEYDWMASY